MNTNEDTSSNPFSDFNPDEEEGGDETLAYNEAFLVDLGNLIERYCREFDLDFLHILGCLELQKRVILDAMLEDDSEEETEEET